MLVDVHTHIYPPSYIALLKSRSSVPYIRDVEGSADPRLIILPSDDDSSKPIAQRGRPVGPDYHDIARKISFMDQHKIDTSVISLANPWLDFVPSDEAAATAKRINDEVNDLCIAHPGRLFAFGTLPLSGSAQDIVAEVGRLQSLKCMRGVIIGTSGLGNGLDDQDLDKVWQALEATDSMVFLHPHYGLPSQVFGPRAGEYGHVLPLALGFPLETTIAVTRMLMAGVFDRFPKLKVLLAHSGGTLPFLAGRIQSCIEHDGFLEKTGGLHGRRPVWDVLKQNIFLDAVVYSEVGLRAAIDASGSDRILFGTDHPFFPPLDKNQAEWASVKSNTHAVLRVLGDSSEAQAVLGGNAKRLLRLDI